MAVRITDGMPTDLPAWVTVVGKKAVIATAIAVSVVAGTVIGVEVGAAGRMAACRMFNYRCEQPQNSLLEYVKVASFFVGAIVGEMNRERFARLFE